MTTTGQHSSRSGRVWRAGRGSVRLQLQSILTLAVSFICLAAALLVVTNLGMVRDRWSRAGRATVYLHDGTPDEDITALTRALEATPGVRRVRVVSAVEARREVLSDESDAALAALPVEAFPTSLELGFTEDIEEADLASIAAKLRSLRGVDSVETYQRWTERLSSLLGSGVTASVCLAIVVFIAVISVVASTMRLLLQRRRTEVEVLKLVGATNAFVRRPFVLEGASQGAAGAAAAIVLLGAFFLVLRSQFDQELGTLLGVTPAFLPWTAMVGMVALGGMLGAATALVSLRRLGTA